MGQNPADEALPQVQDNGSSDSGSSSTWGEIDEEWTRRLLDIEKANDHDKEVEEESDDPIIHLPFLSCRASSQILERIEEVSNEDHERSSSPASSSACGSSGSSVERLWASVPQAGHGAQPLRDGASDHSPRSPSVVASFRTRSPPGPKDNGPLSKL